MLSPPRCSRRPSLTWLARTRRRRARRDRARRAARGLPGARRSRCRCGTVERAGTGDLVTRSTGDIEALARTRALRRAGGHCRARSPSLLIGAARLPDRRRCSRCRCSGRCTAHRGRHPVVPPPRAAGYLRRARALRASQRRRSRETVDGARTVEALGLGDAPDRAARRRHRGAGSRRSATRCGCARLVPGDGARPTCSPIALSAALAAAGSSPSGSVTLGQVTAVALYAVRCWSTRSTG